MTTQEIRDKVLGGVTLEEYQEMLENGYLNSKEVMEDIKFLFKSLERVYQDGFAAGYGRDRMEQKADNEDG